MPVFVLQCTFPKWNRSSRKHSLSSKEVCDTLEKHYRDMQDMEFTVEHGKLYMLQTRNGKRTAQAALKIACDLVDEGMRTEEEAVAMIDPRNLDTSASPTV